MKMGTSVTAVLMDVFVCAVAVKVFGWWAISVGVGIYAIGWIINFATKHRLINP